MYPNLLRVIALSCLLVPLTAGTVMPVPTTPLGPARTQATFAEARTDSDGWVLTRDKVLRMPGTTRERALLPAGTRLTLDAQWPVRADGVVYDVLLWHGVRPDLPDGSSPDGGFQQDVTVLAVFPAGQTAPQDVAEVQTDRLTFRGNPPLIALGSEDAFTLVNHHANAGQPYAAESLFHLRGGRLRRIAEVATLGQLGGPCAQTFLERVGWAAGPGANKPTVKVTVTLTHAPRETREQCTGKPAAERVEQFADEYRWDAARDRYVRVGGTLGALDKWNEARY